MKQFILWCCCLILYPMAVAETYALIIGINEYQHEDFTDLKGAVNDANLIMDDK